MLQIKELALIENGHGDGVGIEFQVL